MSAHHRTSAWTKITKTMRPILKASLPAPCVNHCVLGGVVYPEQAFDVAHIVDVALGGTDDRSNLGPAHCKCNRSDGGKAGRAKQIATKREALRYPQW